MSLFHFHQVRTNPEGAQRSGGAVELYVAGDMSPLQRPEPSAELRADIARTSTRVQQLFEKAMRRAHGG
jgi:hypothetical protein